MSLHGQGQDHVVGGAQGESLQEFENLAEDQTSHPPSVQDLPHQLTCDEGKLTFYQSDLSVWQNNLILFFGGVNSSKFQLLKKAESVGLRKKNTWYYS